MNSNRHVLRPTQNRLPLQDVSSQKYASIELKNQTKLSINAVLQQQENFAPSSLTNKIPAATRPILTAVRSIKRHSKENENCTDMLISPMVKTNFLIEQKLPLSDNDNNKTREQLEQDLYEL